MTGLIALIGDPVSGSVSPSMQGAAFEACGLDLEYLVERVTLQDLPAAFASLPERFVGLNVTIPLKEAVIPFMTEMGLAARRAGSVNTVTFGPNGATGDSTDGAGFMAALRQVDDRPVGHAVLLGTGGAARAVATALSDQGTSVTVAGRNEPAGSRLAIDVGGGARFLRFDPGSPAPGDLAAALAEADLVVNATPLGSAHGPGGPAGSPLPAGACLRPGTTVFDLVYRPRRTALLEQAARTGCRVVEGIEMLVEQGARSFEIWTCVAAPVDVMRQAAYAALEER